MRKGTTVMNFVSFLEKSSRWNESFIFLTGVASSRRFVVVVTSWKDGGGGPAYRLPWGHWSLLWTLRHARTQVDQVFFLSHGFSSALIIQTLERFGPATRHINPSQPAGFRTYALTQVPETSFSRRRYAPGRSTLQFRDNLYRRKQQIPAVYYLYYLKDERISTS